MSRQMKIKIFNKKTCPFKQAQSTIHFKRKKYKLEMLVLFEVKVEFLFNPQ